MNRLIAAARLLIAVVMALLTAGLAQAQNPPLHLTSALIPYKVESGEIRAPLAAAGDVRRGERLVHDKGSSCVLCHGVPGAQGPSGNLAPPLHGVGGRQTAGQLRLRLVDATLMNPASIMPPYYRVDNLHQVSNAYRGKTLLDAQQIEDVVAYLLTLKELP